MENNTYTKNLDTNFKNIDLAEDTFLKKWPDWVRWILFIPSAFIISSVGMLLYRLITILFNSDGFSSSVFFEIISMVILGALFVYAGVLMVPKYQFIISIILLIIITIIAVISFLVGLLPSSETGILLTLIYDIAVVVGAMIVVVWVHNEIKTENNYTHGAK